MLRKLGWTGGGLGKDGNKGIEEPYGIDICPAGPISRTGLGAQSTMTDTESLITAVRRLFSNFVNTNQHKNLAFSSEFSTDDCKRIEAYKQGLVATYVGDKNSSEHFIVVNRSRRISETVEHIREFGGETLQYILVDPTG
jgi:hypothetical protein